MKAVTTLAPLRWWDIPELLPVERAEFGDERWSEAMFWSELAQHETRWYQVAKNERNEIVGYAGLCVYDTEQAWIQTLAVRAADKRRGIGTTLLEALLGQSRAKGVSMVALEVRADNTAAQALYARHGFDAVGLRRGYYQPSGVDAVVMTRSEPGGAPVGSGVSSGS